MPGKTPSKRKQRRDAKKLERQKRQKTTTPYAKKGYLKKTGGEDKIYNLGTLKEIEITSGENYKGIKKPIVPSSVQQSSDPTSKTLTKASGVIGQAAAKFAESQFKKVGKVAPSVLGKCGSSRH